MQSQKSRLVALVLAIVLGSLGVHRFYVGKIGTGIIQFLLTITLLFWSAALVWSLIDAVLIACGEFKDKHGLKIKEWQP